MLNLSFAIKKMLKNLAFSVYIIFYSVVNFT
jgi:hypothetical protein